MNAHGYVEWNWLLSYALGNIEIRGESSPFWETAKTRQ